MYILGISAYYHDSSATLIKNGEIIAAAQEERFTRIKHDSSFPRNAIKFCFKFANIEIDSIHRVVFYEKPLMKFERLLETYLAFAPNGFTSFAKSMPVWIKEKIFQKSILAKELSETLNTKINWKDKLLFSEHHLSHSASAFYPSPFHSAAILTLDGVGEWTTTSLAIGKGNKLKILKEIHFPHSLGLLYSAFTSYIGFKVNSGEYKVMGLAPYGRPVYYDLIVEKLISVADDGSFKLDMSYFNYTTDLTMTSKKFHKLFGGPPRTFDKELTQREMDLAASIQKVIQDIVVKLAKNIANDTGEKNLCLAGGVALNCVANGILLREKIFDNIWIQPAAGDAGGSLGAALSVWYLYYNNKRNIKLNNDSMKSTFLGPQYNDTEIETELKYNGAIYKRISNQMLIEQVTSALIDNKAIGWMQGRMEFGPRALGGRSILANPCSPIMQKQLNLKIKYRESFRPFACSILLEDVNDWFDLDKESPYMLLVAKIKKDHRFSTKKEEENSFGIDKLNLIRSSVPAITHVDYTSRIQTVNNKSNFLFKSIISRFKEKTGFPLILNTSFNVRGEPIVCSPTDAFKCFMSTDLDVMVVGNFILNKEDQDNKFKKKNFFYELD